MNRSIDKSFEQAFQTKANSFNVECHEVENFCDDEIMSTHGWGRPQENRGGRDWGRGFYEYNQGRNNDSNDGGNKPRISKRFNLQNLKYSWEMTS